MKLVFKLGNRSKNRYNCILETSKKTRNMKKDKLTSIEAATERGT